MTEKKQRRHKFFHRNLILLVLIVGGLAFLFGHSRWNDGWGHRALFSGDSAKVEEALADIEEDIADKLDIRPEQEPAFKEYTAKLKNYARIHLSATHGLRDEAMAELDKEQPDIDRIAGFAKQMIRQRGNVEDLDGLIDDTAAFYKTLDAEQQEEVMEHLKRHRRWKH